MDDFRKVRCLQAWLAQRYIGVIPAVLMGGVTCCNIGKAQSTRLNGLLET
jgi:hypothetical protein